MAKSVIGPPPASEPDSPPPPSQAQLQPPPQSPFSLRTLYLTLYNLLSAALWLALLGRTAILLPLVGPARVYPIIAPLLQRTQSLAALEILHSAVGLVRSPLLTTAMQVSSRLLVVWAILYPFPHTTALLPDLFGLPTMLLAWSVSEVIRYTFFALTLWGPGMVPESLLWLRYSAFWVLYPLGISSEVRLVTRVAGVVEGRFGGPSSWEGQAAKWAVWAVVGIYVPGSYILFTHMMAQRRKVLGGREMKKARQA